MVTHHGPDTIDIEYLHKDHLGSIQVITKQGNLWQYHQSYDAFGRHRGYGNPSVKYNLLPTKGLTNRGYTGQDHVGDLGLINFRARMYDPKLGIN